MDYLTKLPFNPKPPTIMHIDINSCFASIEQQANELYRNRPIAVAAYTTDKSCIIAPSIEAKRYGIKTGMRVQDGKKLCPELIIIEPDPWKYRNIHIRLRNLLQKYTDTIEPKSIDEFILNFEGTPIFKKQNIIDIAKEIKIQIKKEIGDYLTVSIGIAPNRFLAKLAASLKKPDGLNEINAHNYQQIYQKLKLHDIPYIKEKNIIRLNNQGIFTTIDFINAPINKLKAAFQSIEGIRWYMRLRGWESDDVICKRRSFSNSYTLPQPYATEQELTPILHKLIEKCAARIRKAGYKTKGIHIAILYSNKTYWHHGVTTSEILFDARDIYKIAYHIMLRSPYKGTPVAKIAISCFNLTTNTETQLELFSDITKKENLIKAIDAINQKWGEYVITPAAMLATTEYVPDRIAFGGVKEIEEDTIQNNK